jgi:hypothetical protein
VPHQKLTLYVGGTLVVLIVLLIILLTSGPRRAILPFVPKGHSVVQVIDMARYLGGPAYEVLDSCGHPSARALDAIEEKLGVSFRRQVLLFAQADGNQIVIGQLRPDQLRSAFEADLDREEKRINQNRAKPVQLDAREGHVEGHAYYYCDQEALDLAFASVGSWMACFGDRSGVQRVLKVCSGDRESVLRDELFAAAYSPSLARRAFLYRFEKEPGGKILAQTLAEVLGPAATDVRAAFFALLAAGKSIEVHATFVARDAEAAERLQTQLTGDAPGRALGELLGASGPPRVTRSGTRVAFAASVGLDRFREIVLKDKQGQARNLILALLAN